MTARDGMADLIARLRGECDAGTADYTLGTAVYWSDEQLQDVLDGYRCDRKRVPLMAAPEQTGGATLAYHDYYFEAGNVEGTASGTTAWAVQDSVGSAVAATAYAANLRAGHLRFTADTRGTAYLLSYREFDFERAAAEVWETKAGHAHSRFDLKTDNHDMKRSQIAANCMSMAAIWRRRAKAGQVRRVRSDVNSGEVW